MFDVNNIRLLRKILAKQRRNLSIYQQRQAEQSLLRYIYHHARIQSSQHVGLYLHDFGEIFTQKLINYCFKMQKNVYLPQVCASNQRLYWVKISRHQYQSKRFVRHRLKMLEPKQNQGQSVQKLDLIFMPLLACDRQGVRLGMGGGFYDRTLAISPYRPYRIGLAHDFQYIDDDLPHQKWDEAIDELWTPQRCYIFQRLSK